MSSCDCTDEYYAANSWVGAAQAIVSGVAPSDVDPRELPGHYAVIYLTYNILTQKGTWHELDVDSPFDCMYSHMLNLSRKFKTARLLFKGGSYLTPDIVYELSSSIWSESSFDDEPKKLSLYNYPWGTPHNFPTRHDMDEAFLYDNPRFSHYPEEDCASAYATAYEKSPSDLRSRDAVHWFKAREL